MPNRIDLIGALARAGAPCLRQETSDTEQLDPVRRIASITRVFEAAQPLLGTPRDAIDVGSGFGYGVAYLALQGIRVIGIESVEAKIEQGCALFAWAGIRIARSLYFSISEEPCVMHGDIFSLETTEVADLATLFYISGEMVRNPRLLQALHTLLRPGGRVLLSTEAPKQVVERQLADAPHMPFARAHLLEIAGNFEQTVLVLE